MSAITVLIIPADESKPITTRQLERSDLSMYQSVVGGYIEALDIQKPAATIYLNEEGKLHGLPVNARATALAWQHNDRFWGSDFIVGDVLITGETNSAGEDTDVPALYVGSMQDAA